MNNVIYTCIAKKCFLVLKENFIWLAAIITVPFFYIIFSGCSTSKITCEMCDENYQDYTYSNIATADLYYKLSCDWCFCLSVIQNDLDLVYLQFGRDVTNDSDSFYVSFKKQYILKFQEYTNRLDSLLNDYSYMYILEKKVWKDIQDYNIPEARNDDLNANLRRYNALEEQRRDINLFMGVRERISDYKESIQTLIPKLKDAITMLEKP